MTRTNAREIAVHLIYGMNYTQEPADEAVAARFGADYYGTLADENEIYAERPDPKQMKYITSVVTGVREKQEELDGYIRKYAVGWSLGRISRLARAVMQLAIYEILYVDDVPTGAAVSEAVELTRKYEDEETVSFVNGVLGSFVRGEIK